MTDTEQNIKNIISQAIKSGSFNDINNEPNITLILKAKRCNQYCSEINNTYAKDWNYWQHQCVSVLTEFDAINHISSCHDKYDNEYNKKINTCEKPCVAQYFAKK